MDFYWEDYLAIYMFAALALGLFSEFPVAFVVGGIGLAFGFLGAAVDYFSLIEFYNILPRIWGGAAAHLVLVAAPCFTSSANLRCTAHDKQRTRACDTHTHRLPSDETVERGNAASYAASQA